jgi:hypothetical protein
MQHDPIDLTVHHKNPKNGNVFRVTPYRLHIEGRVKKFEMPTGSGKFFYENGEPVAAADCPKLPQVTLKLSPDEMAQAHQKELYELRVKSEALENKNKELEQLLKDA